MSETNENKILPGMRKEIVSRLMSALNLLQESSMSLEDMEMAYDDVKAALRVLGDAIENAYGVE